jgi:hypothetical protein
MYDFHSRKAYVSADGSWSACEDTITFDTDALTDKQWEIVDGLTDYLKMEYVIAVLDGDDEYVKEIESEFE